MCKTQESPDRKKKKKKRPEEKKKCLKGEKVIIRGGEDSS